MVETFLCIFNCGRPLPPPSAASKSTDIHQPYDKMVQESSTHFTLHETTSRAVTTESIQRQLPPPSAPPISEHEKSGGEPHNRKRQYLVNENYENVIGGPNGPPVKGGQSSHPPLNNANAPSSNVKHNQNNKISKSTSNPAQKNISLDESNYPKQQHHNVGHGGDNRINNAYGHNKNQDVQNTSHQKISNSSRNQPYPSSSSRNADISFTAIRDPMEIENFPDKAASSRQHRNHSHVAGSKSENIVLKRNPEKDILVQGEGDAKEGAAYWSASTGKADLIVHDSITKSKSDKTSSSRMNARESSRVPPSSHTKKDPSSYEYSSSNPHHNQPKHKDHHQSSKHKSSTSKSFHDNPISNKNDHNNYTTSANKSDSKHNTTGVNSYNATGDIYNSDRRHHSKITHHAIVAPPKHRSSTSKKILSSAMVPQHYDLSNTPEIPPPLPSCPPPPLDTPPPTAALHDSTNLPNNKNKTQFSYYPSSSTKYKSTSHNNYQSHPSSLDNRTKLNNHSVHGDNNTAVTVSSKTGDGQHNNKKLQHDNEKIISPPPLSNNKYLSNTKYSGIGSTSKSNPEAVQSSGLDSSTEHKDAEDTKKSNVATTTATTVISLASATTSAVAPSHLEALNKTSLEKQTAPNKSTGAIPKKKKIPEPYTALTTTSAASITKPSTASKSVTSSTNLNHLDEIVSFPLDDSIISSPSVSHINTSSLSNRTKLPNSVLKDPSSIVSSSSSSYVGSSNKQNSKNSQRHYVQ